MTDEELCFLSATEAARLVASREVSPVELVETMLARIETVQPALNPFTIVCAEKALASAREAETAVSRREALGRLHGVPFTVKDMIDVAGERITFGSAMFEHNVPERDSVAVARTRGAGGVLLGITNMAELGHKGTNDNPVWGITRNPWNPDLTPGGSSGGAAAALAAGCGPLALGTDRAGSVRIPAACCAVVGLKGTLGVVPYPEMPGLFDTTSVIGPMARTVEDLALLMSVIAGEDRADPLSMGSAPRDLVPSARPEGSLRGMRIGWAARVGNLEVDREVLEACETAVAAMQALGADVEEVDIDLSKSVEILFALVSSLAYAQFGGRLAEFGDRIDPSMKQGIERGATYSAKDLQDAHFARAEMYRQIEALLERVDVLVSPTLTAPPLSVDHKAWEPLVINGRTVGVPRADWFPYCHPFNHTGHPAISLPCGWTSAGLPVGLQIGGPWYGEDRLIKVAAELEADLAVGRFPCAVG